MDETLLASAGEHARLAKWFASHDERRASVHRRIAVERLARAYGVAL
jgi:hypothetical protein